MRKINNVLLYSPSDLVTFVESNFVSWIDRLYLEFPDRAVPDMPEGIVATILAKGEEHEADYLATLVATGAVVTDLSENTNDLTATLLALRRGDPVIYQAYLANGNFAGYADFLIRAPGESRLGNWHYEVHDTKLAREPKPYHLVQLCCYAEMLEAVQGRRPAEVAVVVGTASKEIHRFRTDDFYFYYSRIKELFLGQQNAFNPSLPPPIRRKGDFGRWNSHVEKLLEEQDHLSRVANITVLQLARLQQNGITTMSALAEGRQGRIRRMLPATFGRLCTQARLQIASKTKLRPEFEVLPSDPNDPRRGLALLPPANDGDIFFDLEGYPLVQDGLEYLFGASYQLSGVLRYRDWWAHDRDAENVAFAEFIKWAHGMWKDHPGMHIYHYAAYEETAVRRLLRRYPGICEQHADDLLRNEVFVDLYTIVRQSLIVGEPRYSLKNIEHLYREVKREGEVASAADSIVAYDNWLQDKDGDDVATSAKLQAIRDYNRDDCESTVELAAWLRTLQANHSLPYLPPLSGTDEKLRELTEAETFAEELLAAIPHDSRRDSDPERWRIQELLAHLLMFHRREDKPMWWAMFARHEMTEEQLCEDLNCLSGVERTSRPSEPCKRSVLYEYRFDPDQDTKLDAGSKCILSHDLTCKTTVETFDREHGLLTVKLGRNKLAPPQRISLIPYEYVDASVITESILKTAKEWNASGTLPPAIGDFIRRARPHIAGYASGPVIPSGAELVSSTAESVTKLQSSTLMIQGPPGTGKTYTGARAILAQIRAGRRVAVTANSHKVINTLLDEVAAAAAKDRVPLHGVHVWRDPSEMDQLPDGIEYRDAVKDIGSVASLNIVGGTAWCFSAPDLEGVFSHLFVDEAGQLSIANLVGMARAAANIVLIGDQMQLNQPIQGVHPGECGLSCLEYLLEGRDTIPVDFGIFLGVTRRMHPNVCSFISGICYEDRLHSFPAAANRHVIPSSAKLVSSQSGLLFVPVEHEGNSQGSDEEIAQVADLIDDLLNGASYQDGSAVRKLTPDDILIVAPYNMQVRKLQSRFPNIRSGTVDKFQGQEAPIVIYSMCASSADECPRGIDFLFSRNRTNVAISRAKSLAIVVASTSLVRTECSSIGRMRLTNIFCRMILEGTSHLSSGT